jgi:flagellar hook-basal body complex protein FliE
MNPLSSLPSLPPITPLDGAQGSSSSSPFRAVFEAAVTQVEALQTDAAKQVEGFLRGENGDLHRTVMATQRAELSMELFLELRNKVLTAYQEIMRQPL